jgi:GNAT superfamily N-acetyltransferase
MDTKTSPPVPPIADAESASHSMLVLSEQQEGVVERHLSQCALTVRADPKASRLLRKLKVRSKQRLYNHQVFDLDTTICRLLSSTVKYAVDKNAPYSEQVYPVLKPGTAYQQVNPQAEVASRLATPTTPQMDILDHLSLIPVLSRALPPEFKTFRQMLCGAGDVLAFITSPYTSRKLPPFIFRTPDLTPPKVQVNREVMEKFGHLHPPQPPPLPKSIDFCYLQPHHVPAVNNLVSHFFWPVDISECLQYPDFTCVVLYGKLVVGCGFMTPDVKVNEAYISFLLVHPDFQRCSIGKIILYHLIQSCMGKDVTLHVSVDNPAMLLYQTMGFKTERYCIDFYRHYYPEGHYLSKNAYFMRLRK